MTVWRRASRLGLHHEQQHQELILTDIKHAFFCNPLLPAYRSRAQDSGASVGKHAPAVKYGWRMPAAWLRSVFHGAGFAFDNETPRHKVFLHPFRIASSRP